MVTSALTVKQVSAVLSVHPETVKRLLRAGKLKGFKVGKDWRVSEDALRELVACPVNLEGR